MVYQATFKPFSRDVFVVITSLALLAIILSNKKIRNSLPINFKWTWVIIIPLLCIAILIPFYSNPEGSSFIWPVLIIILTSLAVGFFEEVFLRGFAFSFKGDATPRYTVILSSLVFGCLHFTNLTQGIPLGAIIGQVIFAFFIGIIFGVIRVITGSIAWCFLLHGFYNAAVEFANKDSEFVNLAGLIIALVLIIPGIVLVFAHPKMRQNNSIENNNLTIDNHTTRGKIKV